MLQYVYVCAALSVVVIYCNVWKLELLIRCDQQTLSYSLELCVCVSLYVVQYILYVVLMNSNVSVLILHIYSDMYTKHCLTVEV